MPMPDGPCRVAQRGEMRAKWSQMTKSELAGSWLVPYQRALDAFLALSAELDDAGVATEAHPNERSCHVADDQVEHRGDRNVLREQRDDQGAARCEVGGARDLKQGSDAN